MADAEGWGLARAVIPTASAEALAQEEWIASGAEG